MSKKNINKKEVVLVDNLKEDIKKKTDNFLNDQICPHCGREIDAIIIGPHGVRCELCRNRNILEDFNVISKIKENAVVYWPLASSVSGVGVAELSNSPRVQEWLRNRIKAFNDLDPEIQKKVKKEIELCGYTGDYENLPEDEKTYAQYIKDNTDIKTINSPWMRVHMDENIFNSDNPEEFFEKYTGIVVIAEKDAAAKVIPYITKESVKINDDERMTK